MIHKWAPMASSDAISRVLEALGIESIDELYSDIPPEARFKGDWDSLPIGEGDPLDEPTLRRRLDELYSRIRAYNNPPPFAGGGAWAHYVPEVVWSIVTRGEFLTSYTPYQAEASQGLLQALFEYQSMIAELYDMDVVNASMYDGPSALGEAGLQSLRLRRGRRRILVPESMNPRARRVLESYTAPHGRVEAYRVDRETGYVDLDDLGARAGGDVAAIVLEYPSYLGVVDENAKAVGEIAHDAGALYVVYADPLAVALYKPPGQLGADIAVGDGQPLGLGMNYGGPSLGIYAVRWDGKLVRQMPGRLVGMTRDSEERRAFALILQTREQHIRRARATSNITTNQALMAVAAAAYMAYMGGDGLRRIAWTIRENTRMLSRILESRRVAKRVLRGETWRDTAYRLPGSFTEASRRALERGALIGPGLQGHLPWLTQRDGIIAVTEQHTRDDMELLAKTLEEVME